MAIAVFFLGKDLNWDQYNYHLYLPYAFLGDRFHTDVMAASTNSFLNPLPYLPFYWMAMAEWNSLAIGLVIGSFHALSLMLLWELAAQVLFRDSAHAQRYALLSVALAAACPVFLGLVGGTFIEPTTAVLIFGGLLLAAREIQSYRGVRSVIGVAVAGLLLGAATGFKLTGIVFAAGLGIALVCSCGRRRIIPVGVTYAGGLLLGYLAVNGWLAFKLYAEFGNPVFPFFNGWFHSPDFLQANLGHDRFSFNSWSELLALPLRMTMFQSWVYVERLSPDIRPVALVLAGLLLLGRYSVPLLLRRFVPMRGTKTAIIDDHPLVPRVNTRGIFMVLVFAAASSALWLLTSANGRYGLPLLMLVGPIMVLALSRVTLSAPAVTYAVVVILTLQAIQQLFAWSPRWDTTDWTPTWYAPVIPPRFQETPFGYLSVGVTHSNSFIAPFLHRKSAFASIAGNTFTFSPDGPASGRFRAFIQQHEGRLRVLYATRRKGRDISVTDMNNMQRPLAPWGLRVDPTDCAFLQVNLENYGATPAPVEQGLKKSELIENQYDTRLITCAVTKGPGEDEETATRRRRLTAVYDQIEKYCPLLFSPRGWHLSITPFGWERRYLLSDIAVVVALEKIYLSRYDYGPFGVSLGKVPDWELGTTPFVCERLAKPW